MSEYSELIKHFDKVRDYMHDFFVYGFRSRDDFKDKKSLRTYDNEKRRIEGYLADCMEFRKDENGKSVFLCVDSSEVVTNPLYKAFKAKTFTKKDITLHFILLDILYGGVTLTTTEIADQIALNYLSFFENPINFDVSTIRNKLAEYEQHGILTTIKHGKKLLYSLNSVELSLDSIAQALVFFSEISPLGVVGSSILDKCSYDSKLLSYKHHYIMHALESEIVYELLMAIHNKQMVEILNHNTRSKEPVLLEIIPLRFLISVQGGRRYLAAYSNRSKAILSFRLDYIKTVKSIKVCDEFDRHYERLNEILKNSWGASFGQGRKLEHLSMILDISKNESYIINRIQREGRNGTLSKIDETTYKYEIWVYDTMEMIPWLRTFIGRIVSLECDNKAVVRTFYQDLEALYSMYGGDTDVVS